MKNNNSVKNIYYKVILISLLPIGKFPVLFIGKSLLRLTRNVKKIVKMMRVDFLLIIKIT